MAWQRLLRIAEEHGDVVGTTRLLSQVRGLVSKETIGDVTEKTMRRANPQSRPSLYFDEMLDQVDHKSGEVGIEFFNAALKDTNDVHTVSNVLREMRRRSIRPTEATFCALLRFYGQKKDASAIEETLQLVEKHGLPRSRNIITSALLAYGISKQPIQIHELANEMFQRKLADHDNILRIVLKAHVSAGDTASAEQVFRRISERQSRDYAMVMKVYLSQRQQRSALEVFEEMVEEEIQPCGGVYNALISAYDMGDHIEGVEAVLEEMKERRMKLNAVTYAVATRAFSKANDRERVDRLRIAAQVANVKLSDQMLRSILRLYIQKEMGMTAVKELEEAARRGLVPTVQSFNLVLAFFAKRRNEQIVDRLMRSMMALRVEPDCKSYESVMLVRMLRKDFSGVARAFRDMKQRGLKPGTAGYNLLLSVASTTETKAQASDIFDELVAEGVRPDVMTFRRLLECSNGDRTLIERILREMKEFKVTSSKALYEATARALIIAGDTPTAMETIRQMRADNFEVDARTVQYLISPLLEAGERDLVVELAGGVTTTIFERSYQMLITSSQSGEEAERYLRKAIEAELGSEAIFAKTIAVYASEQNYTRAEQLWHEMPKEDLRECGEALLSLSGGMGSHWISRAFESKPGLRKWSDAAWMAVVRALCLEREFNMAAKVIRRGFRLERPAARTTRLQNEFLMHLAKEGMYGNAERFAGIMTRRRIPHNEHTHMLLIEAAGNAQRADAVRNLIKATETDVQMWNNPLVQNAIGEAAEKCGFLHEPPTIFSPPTASSSD